MITMDDDKLIESLMRAWGRSSQANNLFLKKLNSVKWEEKFFAEGEYYFIKGNVKFSTEVLNPFDKFTRKPSFFGSGLSSTGILEIDARPFL